MLDRHHFPLSEYLKVNNLSNHKQYSSLTANPTTGWLRITTTQNLIPSSDYTSTLCHRALQARNPLFRPSHPLLQRVLSVRHTIPFLQDLNDRPIPLPADLLSIAKARRHLVHSLQRIVQYCEFRPEAARPLGQVDCKCDDALDQDDCGCLRHGFCRWVEIVVVVKPAVTAC